MQEYVYQSKKDGRIRQVIVDDNGKHTSKSYPRILMEKKLGRPLEPYEDVHHKDENPSNNDLSNLEIRLHGEHQREHSQKYLNTTEICQVCGIKFVMKKEKWQRLFSDLSRLKTKPRYITCSRSCASKAGSNKYNLLYDANDRIIDLYGEQKN